MVKRLDPERRAAGDELRSVLQRSRAPRIRSMRAFAEREIIIPDGPYAGRRFRTNRQPYTGLWLDAVDSGQWRRFFSLGPTQSGKTLLCFVIPVLYHLFEMNETVVCGVPSLDMVKDKWEDDLLPAIETSRYRDLLPRSGSGSRGGAPTRVKFRNGATLRFMTGGGGDKVRAHFTTRVVVVTETDGFAEPGKTSLETSKLRQLEARTRAYQRRARFYAECTVTIEEGPTWSEYKGGTQSRIAIPCPKCDAWVTPGREHLDGWKAATTIREAETGAAWMCPVCEMRWSDDERVTAVSASRLVHDGQELDPLGEVIGEPKQTDTLGFRWSAPDNLFVTAADVAADEWRGMQSSDEEVAERELCQFVWATPHQPPKTDLSLVTAQSIQERTTNHPRGVVPPAPRDASWLTVGIDLGQYLCHWVAIAFRAGASGQIIDYGRMEVASADLGVERALLAALREMRDQIFEPGWRSIDAEVVNADAIWIDSGWMPEVAYDFCRESGAPYMPCKGYGAGQRTVSYHRPTSRGGSVIRIGEGYHITRLPPTAQRRGVKLVEIDADYWKTWLHKRLSTPVGQPGALTLHQAAPNRHLSIAKHFTAERQVEEFDPKKGNVVRWDRISRANHWFDAAYLACAAGAGVGVRLIGSPADRSRRTKWKR